ncbi:MAG: hypothetical protein KDC26_08365 [Armatimonadetes bacterium]|nr:hypothetical protein [Armatimonadota bacterium]
MQKFEDQFSIEERVLMREELTDGEVSEILTRLSYNEFGGSEKATVGAVCEATGAGPLVVGRMLAEIRQTNLDELINQRFEAFEDRVDEQDEKLKHHARKIGALESRLLHRKPRPAPAIAQKEEENEEQGLFDDIGKFLLYAVVFLMLIFFVFTWTEVTRGINTFPTFP